MPNLTHRAEPWEIIENVVVSATARRKGVGRALMGHMFEIARSAGCFKVQLMSGKHRAEAHHFYRSMGLEAVAEGFKIYATALSAARRGWLDGTRGSFGVFHRRDDELDRLGRLLGGLVADLLDCGACTKRAASRSGRRPQPRGNGDWYRPDA